MSAPVVIYGPQGLGKSLHASHPCPAAQAIPTAARPLLAARPAAPTKRAAPRPKFPKEDRGQVAMVYITDAGPRVLFVQGAGDTPSEHRMSALRIALMVQTDSACREGPRNVRVCWMLDGGKWVRV